MGKGPAGGYGSPMSDDDYAAALMKYLERGPAYGLRLGTLGQEVRRPPTIKSLRLFVQQRPEFRLGPTGLVVAVPPLPKLAAPAPGKGSAKSHADYAAALTKRLMKGPYYGLSLSTLGQEVERPPDIPSLKQFLLERPDFKLCSKGFVEPVPPIPKPLPAPVTSASPTCLGRYADALKRHIQKHGPRTMADLGKAVTRPPGILTLKKLLKHDKDFSIDAAGLVTLTFMSATGPQTAVAGPETPQKAISGAEMPQRVVASGPETPQKAICGLETPQGVVSKRDTPQSVVTSGPETPHRGTSGTETPQRGTCGTETPQRMTSGTEMPQRLVSEPDTPQTVVTSGPETPQKGTSGPGTPQRLMSEPDTPQGVVKSGPETPQKVTSGRETHERVTSGTETPQRGTTRAEAPQRGTSVTETPQIGMSGMETPQRLTSGPETPQRVVTSGPETPQRGTSGPETAQTVVTSGPETPQGVSPGPETPQGVPSGPEMPQRVVMSGPDMPQRVVSGPEMPQRVVPPQNVPLVAQRGIVGVLLAGLQPVTGRNANQWSYLDALRSTNPPIVVGVGAAGTGKTHLACAVGLEKLLSGEMQHMVVTRPSVSVGEDLGYLPGDMESKMQPWVRPIFDALHKHANVEVISKLGTERVLEVCPLGYMRGCTFENTWIVADELQNCSVEQMTMLLTRLGAGSKLVLTGDPKQSDRAGPGENGLVGLLRKFSTNPICHVEVIQFTEGDAQRHSALPDLLRWFNG